MFDVGRLLDWFNQGNKPNRLSRHMGDLIKRSREEHGYSQDELAQRVYKRRPAISEMEHGKMYPDVETLMMLSLVLHRPLVDFFPPAYRNQLAVSDLTEQEAELILQFRRIQDETRLRLAVTQVKAIADLET